MTDRQPLSSSTKPTTVCLQQSSSARTARPWSRSRAERPNAPLSGAARTRRSEEHTSELQSHVNLVCRLLLEKKNSTPSVEHRVRRRSHVPKSKSENQPDSYRNRTRSAQISSGECRRPDSAPP